MVNLGSDRFIRQVRKSRTPQNMACPRVGACLLQAPGYPTLLHALFNLHSRFVELSGLHVHRLDKGGEKLIWEVLRPAGSAFLVGIIQCNGSMGV